MREGSVREGSVREESRRESRLALIGIWEEVGMGGMSFSCWASIPRRRFM